MKHKKDSANVKSVNKSPKSSSTSPEPQKSAKDAKPADGHQEIVKRLMTHSQYYPTSSHTKPATQSQLQHNFDRVMNNHFQPYSMPPQYPATYNHQIVPSMYDQQQLAGFYAKDYYYQHQQTYNQFANINSCPTPSLSPEINNFDQVSNGSTQNNYVFNGDFTWNINTYADEPFPLIDGAKTQLLDHQPSYEIKSFGEVRNAGQLSPVTIESQPNDEIKNTFGSAVNLSSELPSLSDDDVLSVVSGSSSPSGLDDWSFNDGKLC